MKNKKKNIKDKIREAINSLKSFLIGQFLYLLFFISLFVSILFYLINPEIKKEMLFWLFSSLSQSMAAIFAVVGMFAVFRFQNLNEHIRHEIQILRNQLDVNEYSKAMNEINHRTFTDSELINQLKKILQDILQDKEEDSNSIYYNNIDVSVLVIEHNVQVRDYTKKFAMIPIVAIFITFIFSAISLLFVSNCFSLNGTINSLGFIIIIITLFLAIISMVSVLRYFTLSFE